MKTTRTHNLALLFGTLLLLWVGGAFAQTVESLQPTESVTTSKSATATIESLTPIESNLQSLVADPSHGWVDGKVSLDLYKSNLEWNLTDSMSVSRNFSQKRVESKGSAFNTAVQEQLTESLSLNPFAKTNFTLSRVKTELSDLGMSSLSASSVETMGLTQKYGGGDTGGSMSFTRKVTESYRPGAEGLRSSAFALSKTTQEETFKLSQGFTSVSGAGKLDFTRSMTSTQTPGAYANETASDALRLTMGLWADSKFTGVYERSHANRDEGLQSQHRAMTLARKFRAGDASMAFDTVSSRVNGADTVTTTQAFKVPLSLRGRNVAMAFDAKTVDRNETMQSDSRSMSLATKFAGQDAKASWAQSQVAKSATVTEKTTTQSLLLPFQFSGTAAKFALDSKTVQRGTDLISESRTLDFATKLFGSDAKANWSRAVADKGGKDEKTTKAAYAMALPFMGEQAKLSFSENTVQLASAVQKKERTATVALPLTQLQKGASLTYQVQGTQKTGGALQEVRTATLVTPLSLLGQTMQTELVRSETETAGKVTTRFAAKGSMPVTVLGRNWKTENQYAAINRPDGTEQNQWKTNLSIPFKSGAATFNRDEVVEVAADGTEKVTRTTNIAGPKVPLGNSTSLQADVQLKALPTAADQQITHVAVQSKPTPAVTLAADFRVQDLGPNKETTQQQLDASYALNQRLSLNARYLEREQLDKSPYIQRTVVVQQKGGDAKDLQLKAAFTSTDDGKTDGDLMKLIEVGVGDAKVLGVNVRYQEYDEAKLTSLGDPTVKVGLTHGAADAVNVSLGYEDSKGRVAPMRNYALGLPLGGSAIKLVYSQNGLDPTDPKQQRIRVADVYDASLSRKLCGDLSLNLGYRYLDYPETSKTAEDVEQWFQVKLTGGKAENGGSIQLGYAAGDFVDLNKDKPANTAQSILTLNYERKWSDVGSLSVRLNRTNMPDNIANLEDSYEGRVQFEYKF